MILKIVLKHNVHWKIINESEEKSEYIFELSKQFLRTVFSKKQAQTLYLFFSWLKIEKPFAHIQKVRIYLYRLSAKYSFGDLIILNTRVKCQLSSARDTTPFNPASPLIISNSETCLTSEAATTV